MIREFVFIEEGLKAILLTTYVSGLTQVKFPSVSIEFNESSEPLCATFEVTGELLFRAVTLHVPLQCRHVLVSHPTPMFRAGEESSCSRTTSHGVGDVLAF